MATSFAFRRLAAGFAVVTALSAAVCLALARIADVRHRPVGDIKLLLILGIPIVVAGQVATTVIAIRRIIGLGNRIGVFGRIGFRDMRRAVFGRLPRPVVIVSCVLLAAWLFGIVATNTAPTTGAPTDSSRAAWQTWICVELAGAFLIYTIALLSVAVDRDMPAGSELT